MFGNSAIFQPVFLVVSLWRGSFLNGQKLRKNSARNVRVLFGFAALRQSGFSRFAHAQRAREKVSIRGYAQIGCQWFPTWQAPDF
jgi:hypothetical protein